MTKCRVAKPERTLVKEWLLNEVLDVERKDSIRSYARILRECGEAKAEGDGKLVHWLACRFGVERATLIGNSMIQMYGSCKNIIEARFVFDTLQEPNVISWTVLVAAYSQNGHMCEARMAFDSMPWRDVVAWNAMIALYSGRDQCDRALEIFWKMNLEGTKPNEGTLVSVMPVCVRYNHARQLHQVAGESGEEIASIKVANSIVTMYAKCGCLSDSETLFCTMPSRDIVTWNVMIGAYAHAGHAKQALGMFKRMCLEGIRADDIAVATVLDACSDLRDGKDVHLHFVGCCKDVVVATALIGMYGRCGSLGDARQVFDTLDINARDVVSWTAMIGAYVKNECHEGGVYVFRLMDIEGIAKPNDVTFTCVLDACAELQDVRMGKALHACLEVSSILVNPVVSTAVIDMYAKCGDMKSAREVFSGILIRNVVGYNAMIAGYAANGEDSSAVNLYREMELHGFEANEGTFVSILSLCSHHGEISSALIYLARLWADHGLRPNADHYACVVDLLARAGFLHEAEVLVSCVPSECTALAWITLLGACKTHEDVDRGVRAALHATHMDPTKAASYLLLSNIHGMVEQTGPY